ncbi:PKD domain-containing protein [Nostoc ellipsosporum NOK]|nr:PKD domain-containing protein [Nostoc ellipsosporum NOK]
MASYSFYSRSFLGLDKRVWFAMGGTLLAAVLLLAFKVATHVRCTGVNLTATGTVPHATTNVFYVNEKIRFTASMTHASEISWDFGDQTPGALGAATEHKFAAEGTFLVTVEVNGKCRESMRIQIRKMAVETSGETPNPINGNTTLYAGTPEVFTSGRSGNSYLWYIEEDASMGRKTDSAAAFTFNTTGDYTLVLQLNGDTNNVFRKTITVLQPGSVTAKTDVSKFELPDLPTPPVPKKPQPDGQSGKDNPPPAPTPSPDTKPAPPSGGGKKYIRVADEALKMMLNEVIDKKLDANGFDQVLCNGAQSQVIANGKFTTLTELVKSLQVRRGLLKKIRAKIRSVKQVPDPDKDNKCLLSIKVDYDWD